MRIRILKKPGWADYYVQTWAWYWPFWRTYERNQVLARAHEIAAELANPIITRIK